MSQKHYQSQFKVVLGVGAWPGTLNVDVGSESMDDFSHLRVIAGLDVGTASEAVQPLRIEGFERDGRSFGGATAFRGRIRRGEGNWEECAILIPDLTRHTSTAEVISGAFLRESLPCTDGDLVEIELNSA
jgi:CTP-dependent riboflavin kinase